MKLSFLKNVVALYGPHAAARLVAIYRQAGGPFHYLGRYWTTQDFAACEADTSKRYRTLRLLLGVGMAVQVAAAAALFYSKFAYNSVGSAYLGGAMLVSYPLVWAHVLFLLALGWALLHPKRYGKAVIATLLEGQVRQLRARNDFTLIAVAGSVGKTSTKLAVAELLAGNKRVCYQQGNYNDRLTVPLVLFGASEPNIYNLAAWAKIYMRNRHQLRRAYPFDVAVVELGTDAPGQMKDFAYLQPDLAIVTAVSEEHMEYFKTLDAVAAEELTVFDYATKVLINTDDVAAQYLAGQSYDSYGTTASADYQVKLSGAPTKDGQELTLTLKDTKLSVQTRYFGQQGGKIVLAAAAIGHMLGVGNDELRQSLASLQPFSGRMQLLAGVEDTTLFDDTYNASPLAVKAALDVLYAMETSQRIAILGSMNELGETSRAAHEGVGAYCDSKKLSLVVTIGKEANEYLAPAAKARGCEVKSFDNPQKAGEFVRAQLKSHAAVLAKGSQNGVFAEETLKPLLLNPDDASKLVRQSDYWMHIKSVQFGE